MPHYTELPSGYRPCSGAVVFNANGDVFMGCRIEMAALDAFAWQMPQGGLDAGEDPEAAARRELYEETGIRLLSFYPSSMDGLHMIFRQKSWVNALRIILGRRNGGSRMASSGMRKRSIYVLMAHQSSRNGTG